MKNGDSSVLFHIVCAGNIFKHGNLIVSNDYKNGKINKTIIVTITI